MWDVTIRDSSGNHTFVGVESIDKAVGKYEAKVPSCRPPYRILATPATPVSEADEAPAETPPETPAGPEQNTPADTPDATTETTDTETTPTEA